MRVLVPGSDRQVARPRRPGAGGRDRHVVEGELPGDLPHGYHRLHPEGHATAATQSLIVSPGHCFLPDNLRTWGFAAQVYAARSRAELGDRRPRPISARIGRFTKRLGGGVVMVNPMAAPTPVHPIEPSPYYPSSRRFANPLFLRVEEVPGWERLDAGTRERLGNAGRALNAARKIDRDAIFKLKMEALEAIFAGFDGEDGFDWFRWGRGQALTDFATYCALAEQHGKDWRSWPAPAAPPRRRRHRRLSQGQRRAHRLSRLAAVAARHAAGARRRGRSPSSTTCRSASTSPAPTPGAGRTCWRATSRSARRPTSSTPPARTGG